MSDIFQWLHDRAMDEELTACIAVGNRASAELTQMRMDLARDWHPTGYYSPEQIEQVHAQIKGLADRALQFLEIGLDVVNNMPESSYPAILRERQTQLARSMEDGRRFLAAAQKVREHGSGVVDAPDFKKWVMLALGNTDDAVTAAAMVACNQPWWSGLYSGFSTFVNFAVRTIKAIVGVVLAVGEFVVNAGTTAGKLATTLKWVLILGVGGVAAYAGLQFYRKHSSGGGLLPELPKAWQLPED
jgi:hypothetical protein